LPTWILVVAIHCGWLSLTFAYHALPLFIALPAAAVLIAWHGSLQHEAVHGHPTSSLRLNALVAGAPLSLWLPFSIYRESHFAHHRCKRITDPTEDTESYYVGSKEWDRLGRVQRALHWALSTLLGRLLLGPVVVVLRFLSSQLRGGARRHARGWIAHALGCALVLGWVSVVCHIPLLQYLCVFVYPGMSLTLLRSYAEHRPADQAGHATAIVEAGPLLSLLYLHNNLHAVHHAYPHLAWYELPARWRRERASVLAGNGRYYFGGYDEIVSRFALRPKDAPHYPRSAK
jgi:fatty acid desaturase